MSGRAPRTWAFATRVDFLFTCQPAHEIKLEVLDENGEPTTAAFEIRDQLGRVYPSQTKRAAPDFAFHPQIYRAHGETIRLPTGTYTIRNYRGPESLPQERKLEDRPEHRKTLIQDQDAGSIPPSWAGGRVTITSTPRAAPTTPIPPRASTLLT